MSNKGNREYKDTVFSDLFYSDIHAKEHLLELYNALYNKHLTDPDQIVQIRLENTVFMGMHNDIGFEVEGKNIVLNEHQSTINYNMPIRNLMYIGREYERLLPVKARYKKELMKIPKPEFFTFYNGKETYPAETVLKLSDAYWEKDDNPALELTVKVININHEMAHEILKKCRILGEYSEFVSIVRYYEGNSDAMEMAVKECIDKGILKEYLTRKGSEVVNMLMAEYDYETDIRVQREEAAEKAAKEAAEKVAKEVAEKAAKEAAEKLKQMAVLMHKNDIADEVICRVTGFNQEELESLYNR